MKDLVLVLEIPVAKAHIARSSHNRETLKVFAATVNILKESACKTPQKAVITREKGFQAKLGHKKSNTSSFVES